MKLENSNHKPNADYRGEEPTTWPTVAALAGLQVELMNWGPQDNVYATIWNATQQTWGDTPCNVRSDDELPEPARKLVERTVAGSNLTQALEGFTFWFQVDGCTRACTHQLVRTRIGCSVMQHSGRSNDLRNRRFVVPETYRRFFEKLSSFSLDEVKRMVPSWTDDLDPSSGHQMLEKFIDLVRQLYAAMVDAGIPYQDARRILPIGMDTRIELVYNWSALVSTLSKRLEHVMDWEINAVAQLMAREVRMKCPAMFGRALGSLSDKLKKAAFAGEDLFPPDGKHPVYDLLPGKHVHSAEQNPFWVLHPDSEWGGPIKWISTNGKYPEGVELEVRPDGHYGVVDRTGTVGLGGGMGLSQERKLDRDNDGGV